MEMIDIPAGNVILGTGAQTVRWLVENTAWGKKWVEKGYFSREQPQHNLFVDQFKISKFPVTVGEYKQFIQEDGYDEILFWTKPGCQWVQTEKITEPAFWTDEQWCAAEDLPVVGVSWYEAVAYCRWLTSKTGKEINLPSEVQWERAARGDGSQIYPWGNVFDSDKCNTRSGGKNRTLSVGSYSPSGDSPFGCCEMVGNVSEWTASKFFPYPYTEGDGREDVEGSEERVTRGGSWHSPDFRARVSSRGMNDPFFRDNDLGFRIVMLVNNS